MSKGEDKIASILRKEQIDYFKEYHLQKSRIEKYRFDFYIPDKKIFIEYQGEQHYYFVEKFYKTRDQFLAAQERDRKKCNAILAARLKLYCIPFFEIENVNSFKDLTNPKFLVKSQWHNDMVWQRYRSQKSLKI